MREYTLQISPEKELNPYTTPNWIDVRHVSCEPGEVVSTPPSDFWPRAAWWLKLTVPQYIYSKACAFDQSCVVLHILAARGID